MKFALGLLIVFTTVFMSGCGFKYYIHPDPEIELEGIVVPKFSRLKVALKNVQSFNDNIIVWKRAGNIGYANPKEFTDIAITIAGRELKNKGLDISQDAAKELKMSVDTISTDMGTWGTVSKVNMIVETGDGYSAEYNSSDTKVSWGQHGMSGQYSNLLMRAVQAMLADKKIIKYLSN